MNGRRVVDLAAVRGARERLRALAVEHPELCGPGDVDAWAAILMEDEANMSKTEQVAIRMEPELLERIDAHVEHMKSAMPGVNLSRADAIRALLLKALGDEPKKPRRGHA